MIYIIIVNHKNTADTLACLESLRRLENTPPHRMILVDNSLNHDLKTALSGHLPAWQSHDPSFTFTALTEAGAEALPVAHHRLTLLEATANGGFAAANNLGLKLALKDPALSHAWLLNNDTEVTDTRTLEHCLAAWQQLPPNVGLVGGKVYFHGSPQVLQCIGGRYRAATGQVTEVGLNEPDQGQYDRPPAVIDYPCGACMMASRAFLEAVGLLNEAYFLFFEELDWSVRGRARGFEVAYMPELVIWHKHNATIGGLYGSLFSDVEFTKSEVRFVRLHNPSARRVIFLRGMGRILKRVLHGHFSRVIPIARAMRAQLPPQSRP